MKFWSQYSNVCGWHRNHFVWSHNSEPIGPFYRLICERNEPIHNIVTHLKLIYNKHRKELRHCSLSDSALKAIEIISSLSVTFIHQISLSVNVKRNTFTFCMDSSMVMCSVFSVLFSFSHSKLLENNPQLRQSIARAYIWVCVVYILPRKSHCQCHFYR